MRGETMSDWSVAVANQFLKLAKQQNKTLTQMQLQKLTYIAHGWNLAISGASLTNDAPEAWDYGPVYRELREALRRYGSESVDRKIRYLDFDRGLFYNKSNEEVEGNFSDSEQKIIGKVFEIYGDFRAFQLSALTHKDGTPWQKTYHNSGRNSEIKAEEIKEHFIGLAKEGTAATR
jgi:uncharacterized phage-associated protein